MVLASVAGALVIAAGPDDEGAAVRHAQGALRNARDALTVLWCATAR